MNPFRRIVDQPAFTGVVVAVILANALILGLQTYPGIESEYGRKLDLLNLLCLAFFVVEIAIRIAAYGRRPWEFFRDGWNIFDFVAVWLAFLPGLRENATVLRLARLARIVRVVHLLPDVRILITGVVRSLPPLAEHGDPHDADHLRLRDGRLAALRRRDPDRWGTSARRC